MKKIKKHNILNFPLSLSYGEKEVEAILFAAAEPLDIDTIESKVPRKVNVLSILNKLKDIYKESKNAFEFFIKKFKKNIEVFDVPGYFKDIPKQHQIIHETDLANNFQAYYKKDKKKLSKEMREAIERGLKYSAYDYANAIDFIKQSYESYKEVFEDYHGVITPSSSGVADKGLKSTGSADFQKTWTYLGLPTISLPLLTGENDLPLGVQLVGDKLDDLRFLGTANWLEKNCKDE